MPQFVSLLLTGVWICMIGQFGCCRADEPALPAEPGYVDGIFQKM